MQYFAYDDFGRLMTVKDMNGNIIKAHQYQLVKPNYNPTPVWVPLPNFKCLPCPQNPTYSTGILQRELEDQNPASLTYGSRKWINHSSCAPAGGVAVWQPTGTKRCLKDVYNPSYNNGLREQEEKDVNPCSPSYNAVRWVGIGTDLAACPDNRPIYVRVCMENKSGSYGDVVIRTFSDQAGNYPRPVQGLSVNILEPGVGVKVILLEGEVNYMYRNYLIGAQPFRVGPGVGYIQAYETCN
jgi:hypothetical protein